MGLIKFFTIFDDEYRNILRDRKQRVYDVNGYPSVFFINDKPYYESLNGNAKMYCDALAQGFEVKKPVIPAAVFEAELVRAYNEGFLGAAIVCPHAYWTDHKHQAEIAVKRFRRKTEIDELGFNIKIYDSKQLGAAVPYLTYFFSEQYRGLYQSTSELFSFMEFFKLQPMMYVIEEGPCEIDSNRSINAFSIIKNRVKKFEISTYPDSVIFDKFAEIVINEAKKYSRDVVISVGSECVFAGNVIGRVIKGLGKPSLCTVQYGVTTASVLGNKAVCISLV